MTIADSIIRRVRARIETFDVDPKLVESYEQLTSRRAQLPNLAVAIGTFVDGGGLSDLASAYRRPFPPGWDVWLANDMADHLSDDDEVTSQFRRMILAPKDGNAARESIDELGSLIDEAVVVRDSEKSGSAYSPVFLSNCWHAQEPGFWQQYTAKRLKTLKALAPELWGQDELPSSHGARYRDFNHSLTMLANALRIQAWDLTARLELKSDGSSSEDGGSGDGRRYWLMALGENSEFWNSCHADGVAIIGGDDEGDLLQYDSKDQLRQRGLGKNDSLALWQFCHEMKRGDMIFVKRGRELVLGHGVVR